MGPEIHGDIPSGKGEPPAAYFQRMEEKGAKGTGRAWRPTPEGEGKGKMKAGGEHSREELGGAAHKEVQKEPVLKEELEEPVLKDKLEEADLKEQ